jgi:hypothetical protein
VRQVENSILNARYLLHLSHTNPAKKIFLAREGEKHHIRPRE